MLQTYAFTGSGRQIDAMGTSFRYESGTDGAGITEVTLRIDGVPVGTFEPGDQLDIPTACKRWELVPTSSGCTGRVRIGLGRVTSAKLNGVVQTVDGGRSRSLAGGALAGAIGCGQVAGQFSQVQIYNKAGSGKTIVINDVGVFGGGQTSLNSSAFISSTPLANLANSGGNKRGGGSVSAAAELRAANAGAAPSGPFLRSWWGAASSGFDWRLTEPIVLPPGFGLTFHHWNAATDLSASFEWFEE